MGSTIHSVAAQSRIALGDCFFEHTIMNAESDDPSKRYRLYTVVQEAPKKIICAPDAAFELQVGPYRRAYYVELERGTDSSVRISAKKSSGYAGLAQMKKWKLHFPQASDFRVLCIVPTRSWVSAMQKAMKEKPGSDAWLFVAQTELSVETFLHGDIVHSCSDGPRPLVRPQPPPPPSPQQ